MLEVLRISNVSSVIVILMLSFGSTQPMEHRHSVSIEQCSDIWSNYGVSHVFPVELNFASLVD